MSLHGLSKDAWHRYSEKGNWDYKIIAPGYKYNMTDVLAAVGIHQLAKAEKMRKEREKIANYYNEAFDKIDNLQVAPWLDNRIHSWHLYALRLNLDRLGFSRSEMVEKMRQAGVGFSVHWRPLHLHPYYQDLGWRAEHCPVATMEWERLVSLPIFPGLRDEDVQHVIHTIQTIAG